MGQISQTLGEILEIANYPLFLPVGIDDYERLQALIINKFYNREIAYDTVDYFRMRLNYYLALNAPIYNKMLASERIQYDPFVTDYREHVESIQTDTHEGMMEGMNKGQIEGRTSREDTKTDTGETYQGKDKGNTLGNTVHTDIGATLFSEAENASGDKDIITDKTYSDDRNQTTDIEDKIAYGEMKDITYHSEVEQTEHGERDIKREGYDKQTDRKWTEQGNSKAHNLDVSSDTPQAMLFNTPNHYYGTGTADDYGIVVNTTEGESYQHYLESNIDAMDSQPRQINGGDTPWYNYASSAGNKIGHDNYSKSGTETYNVDHVMGEDNDFEGIKNKDQGDTTNQDTMGWKNDTKHTEDNEHKEGNENVKGKESTLNSKATNSNEHTKQDGIESRNEESVKQNQYKKATNLLSGITSKSDIIRNEGSSRNIEKGASSDTYREEVYKGRTYRSPAQLLSDYRDTITYSADKWILSELEKVFLQIF